jgi:hypothetical protein
MEMYVDEFDCVHWSELAELCFQMAMAAVTAATLITDGLSGGRTFWLSI